MTHFSLLFLIQAALVLMGVTFQIIAMTAMHRDTAGGGKPEEPRETWREKKERMAQPRLTKSARTLPTRQRQDYYEMECTPPGVRPAELRKTARVKYVDDFKAPPPTQEEEAAPTLNQPHREPPQ